MSNHIDPARDNPGYDWRDEVNWSHVKSLIRLHSLYWAFGAVQVALYATGLLTGTTRTFIGLLDYAFWAILAVLLIPIVTRPRYYDGSDQVVSVPTLLVLFAFMASLFAYIFLLGLIGLGSVELFPNPQTSLPVKIITILAGVFVLSGFVVAWQATIQNKKIIAWIKKTYPKKWNALPWTFRQLAVGIAIERLKYQGLQSDCEFQRRYNEIKRLRRRMIILIIVGSFAIGIVIHGTSFWGWSW